jgi:hypothetical protein
MWYQSQSRVETLLQPSIVDCNSLLQGCLLAAVPAGVRKKTRRTQLSTMDVWLALTWRLVLAFLVSPAMGQASASATSSSTFLRAMTDPTVSLILIPPDNFELIPEEWCVTKLLASLPVN